jgi:hypothetical protein
VATAEVFFDSAGDVTLKHLPANKPLAKISATTKKNNAFFKKSPPFENF